MDTNYLSTASFSISIDRLPNVEFNTQKINIPSISSGNINTGSPLGNIFNVGDRLEYDDLILSFIVNETMDNYLEITNWLIGISAPQESSQYGKFPNGLTEKADIIILITNSHKNPHLRITFVDCFPISLSDIQLDVTATTIEYPEATATFKYNYFKIEKI
jgi:hypothetical protein